MPLVSRISLPSPSVPSFAHSRNHEIGLLVYGAFGRLGDLLVGRSSHVSGTLSVMPLGDCQGLCADAPSELDQDGLHSIVSLPAGKAGQLLGVDDAITRVHARQIDLANELYRGRLIGVVGTAMHLEGVDSVLVDALSKGCQTLSCMRRGFRGSLT